MKIPNNPLDLPTLFKGLKIEELTVLDLGSGRLDSPLSSNLRTMEFGRLVLVERWLRSARDLFYLRENRKLAAKKVIVVTEEAVGFTTLLEVDIKNNKSIIYPDVITLLDLVEHLSKEEGIALLERCKSIASKRVLVWIPVGTCPQGDLEGNPYQVHQSVWEPEDLQALGFQVMVYPQYHKHFDPPVSAAWAVWDREENKTWRSTTVTFTDKEFADTMLNDESIRATEEEVEELRKKHEGSEIDITIESREKAKPFIYIEEDHEDPGGEA